MGNDAERKQFLEQVKKGCRIAKAPEIGVRPRGVVDRPAAGPADWANDPGEKKIAATFRTACDIAADNGETLAAEGNLLGCTAGSGWCSCSN
jgi:hypothetical protein